MARCLGDSIQDIDNSTAYTSDIEDDHEEFCDNFEYLNSASCWVCNGYYAPNFGEPLCGTCHAFLFAAPPGEGNDDQITFLSDDEDSGNDEPPFYHILLKERQEREEKENLEWVKRKEEEKEKIELGFHIPAQPAPLRTLKQFKDILSQPYESNKSGNNICDLPVEVLLSIFSYLDDLSLWNVSEVCKQWRKILEAHTPQAMWKKYTKERWPLFQQAVNIPNWFQLYGTLMSSSFCRTCLIQMALKTPLQRVNIFRATRLRGDIRSLDVDATEGIDAVPLDHQLSHWQASILGPAGSPYEGGKFFLYIAIPFHYPMCPPTVRFLTKIVHPNVSRHGDVGIDIIQHNWSLALTISKLLLSVQSLLTDPFTQICMEPELGRMYENERPKFEALARRWTWLYAMCELMPPS